MEQDAGVGVTSDVVGDWSFAKRIKETKEDADGEEKKWLDQSNVRLTFLSLATSQQATIQRKRLMEEERKRK